MFDPFQQAKLQNAYSKMKEYKAPVQEDMSLDDLKRLSGVDKQSIQQAKDVQLNKAKYMAEHDIKPASKEWFQLWFAKPDLTGENPFGK
jgi:hypothetical protein